MITLKITMKRLAAGALAFAAVPAMAAETGGQPAPVNEYLELKPAFVTNYGGPGPIHFLKADITLRLTKDEQAAPEVDHHMPFLRHELVMLLSRQTEESLATADGKEKLRTEALAAVQKVMRDETGKPQIDDLLFTNFVVQQ